MMGSVNLGGLGAFKEGFILLIIYYVNLFNCCYESLGFDFWLDS